MTPLDTLRMTRTMRKLHDKAFCAALQGLLADPEDRKRDEGETCTQACVRLAWEHADEAMRQREQRYDT